MTFLPALPINLFSATKRPRGWVLTVDQSTLDAYLDKRDMGRTKNMKGFRFAVVGHRETIVFNFHTEDNDGDEGLGMWYTPDGDNSPRARRLTPAGRVRTLSA